MADLPYRRRPGAETFSTGNRARRRPQNTLQLGLCLLASLLVSSLIATPLLTTTSVMLISIVLAGIGFWMQRRVQLVNESSTLDDF